MNARRIATAGAALGLVFGGSFLVPQADATIACTKCLMQTASDGLQIVPDPTRQGVVDELGDTLVTAGSRVDYYQDALLSGADSPLDRVFVANVPVDRSHG